MINPVFEDIPICTSTPKKYYKNHNCSKNNYTKCDDCLDEVLKHLNKDEEDIPLERQTTGHEDLATGQAAPLLGT